MKQILLRAVKIVALLAMAIMTKLPNKAEALIQMAQYPYWSVGISTQYPTGIGWGDFDNNGWQDLVVTRGLDVVKLPKNIYSSWNGQVDTMPSWVSSDLEAGDNVSIGDIDNDGDLDLLVSHLGITATGMTPVPDVIYINNGSGLFTSPGWYSRPANSFSNALGDADGDGDLDVAIGQGDWLTGHLQPQVIYRNNNGQIDTVPWWQSDSSYYVDEIAFVDIDNDGDLDLATGHERGGVRLFYNNGGIIETTPSWALRTVTGARQIDFGDVDGNGYQDMVIATPLIGYHLFLNQGGVLDTIPYWSYLDNNQPCCVELADIDGDGDLDLAAGAWSSPLVIFEDVGGTLSAEPVWSYTNGNRVEQVCWGDADGDGWRDTIEAFVGDGNKKLYYVSKMPLCRLHSVSINGAPLPLSEYCYHLADGWVSLGNPVGAGDTLSVNYRYSEDPDLVAAHGAVLIFKNMSNIVGTVSPSERILKPGESTEYTIILQRQYGSYGPIELETEILPLPDSGMIQWSLDSDTIFASDTVTLSVVTSGSAKPGSYTINIGIVVGADTMVKTATLDILGSGQAAVVGGDHSMMELVRGIWEPVDSLWSVPPVIGENYQAMIIEHCATVRDTALIRQYIAAGGRVLLTRQTPFDLCGTNDISSISSWVGASGYSLYGGSGIPIVSTYDQPFGVSGIQTNDTIGMAASGFGRLSGLGANGVRLARLGTVNTVLAGVYCGSGSGHCLYYTGGGGISPQSDSLIRGFLINPALGVENQDERKVAQYSMIKVEVWPNPYKEKTTIRYNVNFRGLVKLLVYDIQGRLVNILQEGMHDPGAYILKWDGRNITGQAVSAGVYFIRLSSSGGDNIRKIVKLK